MSSRKASRAASVGIGIVTVMMLTVALGVAGEAHITSAQTSSTGVWLPPINLSNSGSAAQPVITIAKNGAAHVMWWDTFDGMRYLRTTASVSNTVPVTNAVPVTQTRSTIVPGIWGDRQIVTDTRTARQTITLYPPRYVRLLADATNRVHAFWPNATNQLVYTSLAGTVGNASVTNATRAGSASAALVWSPPAALAAAVSAIDVVSDVSGTVHLAFARSVAGQGAPPGLYYRARAGATWSPATLVYSNTYFRADRPDDISLNIAANGKGAVVITWYQARLGQSFFTHSSNAGRTWSPPEPVSGSSGKTSTRSGVAIDPQGGFVLLYQDPAARGCGFNQRKSADAGVTWSAPEISLSDMGQCPAQWHFASSTDKLWLIGALAQSTNGNGGNGSNSGTVGPVRTIVASSDGSAWSASAELSLSARDSAIRQDRILGCLNISIAADSMMAVGCDVRGDVWLASAAIGLDKLIVAPDLTWGKFTDISDASGSVSSPASMTLVKQTDVYAVWGQMRLGESLPTEIYISQWNGTDWLRPARIMSDDKSKFDQPSVAASLDDKLHLVWNAGTLRYSQAFARDASVVSGWSKAVDLPLPPNTNVARSPSITADPRGNTLYVIYSVPYNEKRGIYLVSSDDSGGTWADPVLVFDAAAAGWESADYPQLRLDVQSDSLHVVWLKANLGNRTDPQAVYYARSADRGKSWTKPQLLAEGEVSAPQVSIPNQGQVYVLWNQANGSRNDATPFETWGRLSLDGGERWTDAVGVPGFRQVSGQVALATDGAGRLYLTGITANAGGESELIYSAWAGQDWSQRETVGIGQRASVDNQASSSVLPASGRFVALARTTVFTDSASAQFQVFASNRTITAAQVVAQPTFTPIPTPTEQPASQSSKQTLPVVEPSATVDVPIPTAPQPQGQGNRLRSLAPIAGVIALGVIVIGFGFWRRNRR